MLGNLGLSPWDIIFICNHSVRGKNIEAQCNRIFCKPRFWVILICPRGISFSYVIIMSWVKYWKPAYSYSVRIQMLDNFRFSPWNTISTCNLYFLCENIVAPCNRLFCESSFWLILMHPLEYHFHMQSQCFEYKYWGPVWYYFLRIQILGKPDMSPCDIIPICNPHVLGTIIMAQCNLVSTNIFWLIAICPHGISFPYVISMFWVKLWWPSVILFSADPDVG